MGNGDRAPHRFPIVHTLLQTGQAYAFAPGPADLSFSPGWSRRVELCIQAQAGDTSDRLSSVRQAAQKVQGCITAIDDQDKGALRDPAPELQKHLPTPVHQSLVALLPFLVI